MSGLRVRAVSSFSLLAMLWATVAVADDLPASQELLEDGLPASALRCQHDAKGLPVCGTCRAASDCPRGQGCAVDRITRRRTCMASECAEDADCGKGRQCRALSPGASAVRRCRPAGTRQEGESCDTPPLSPARACREGLRCVNEMCTRPCQLNATGTCPAGYLCEDGLDGPGCFPDCRVLGCARGERCKDMGEGLHLCLAEVYGECPEVPCGPEEQCNVRFSRGRGTFWCARRCEPWRPESCPEGEVCGQGNGTTSTCYRPCDPNDTLGCGEGLQCRSISEDLRRWGCKPFIPD